MSQPSRPTILFVTHALGGGAHRHLNELIAALKDRANCLVACGASGSIALLGPSAQCQAGMAFRTSDQLPALARVLQRLGVDRVDVHHVAGFENQAEGLLKLLGLDFDATLIDYHMIATNPHLCFADGVFVGDHRLADPECGMLRPKPLPLLRRAARVIVISRDMAARVQSFYPDLAFVVARHWRERTAMRVRHVFSPRIWDNEPLRVLVVGWIVENKGRHAILEVARLAQARRLPLRFHVLGEMELSETDRRELAGVITVHGRYPTERYSEMLGSIAPHVGWLPSQVPETWSYVLTDFIEAALPIAANAIGAIPERCYGRPFTWLLPPDSPPQAWTDFFLGLHAANLDLPPRWTPVDGLPPAQDFYFDSYLGPVRNSAHSVRGAQP
jgi:glycosyltransferase involved in cell wall biosynthesis